MSEPNIADSLDKIISRAQFPQLLPLQGPNGQIIVAVGPNADTMQSVKRLIDEYAIAPDRATGVSKHTTLSSLIAHIDRHKTPTSVLFAAIQSDMVQPPRVQAIYNYNGGWDTGVGPQFGDHRAIHDARLSREWQEWVGKNKTPMTQEEFAAFIETNVLDLLDPPDLTTPEAPADKALAQYLHLLAGSLATPAKMVEMSREMQVRATSRVKSAQNLSTGEVAIQFETEHTDASGQALKIPTAFLLGIPVFEGGSPYRLAARLRYRLNNGAVKWSYDLWRVDAVYRDATDGLCATAAEATGLPLFRGLPES